MLMRWRPRIGMIVLAFNLVALALPLSGIWALRIYESALIRQTESELIAQSAVIAASFREAWRLAGGRQADLGPPVDPEFLKDEGETGTWLPRFAVLDLAEDPVLPVGPDDEPTGEQASLPARQAGGALTPIILDAQRTTLAGMVQTFAAVREVAEMSEAIATMSEILAKRADYIANFANHVSHEFKTPLTSIRGAVELLVFTTARASGGTGLGLSIARSLLAAHGGTIALLPEEPGAVFEIRLPLAARSVKGTGERTEPVLFG